VHYSETLQLVDLRLAKVLYKILNKSISCSNILNFSSLQLKKSIKFGNLTKFLFYLTAAIGFSTGVFASFKQNNLRTNTSQVWFSLAWRFQRKRLKYEKLMTTDGAWWQYLTWQLTRSDKILECFYNMKCKYS
jgi:hypothetical protein